MVIDATGGNGDVVTSCQSRDHSGGALVNCTLNDEITDVLNSEGPRCVYSGYGEDGSITAVLAPIYLLGLETTEQGHYHLKKEREWGGDIEACIGGMAQTNWSSFLIQVYRRVSRTRPGI